MRLSINPICWSLGDQIFSSFCHRQFLSGCPRVQTDIPFARAIDFDRSEFDKTLYWVNLGPKFWEFHN